MDPTLHVLAVAAVDRAAGPARRPGFGRGAPTRPQWVRLRSAHPPGAYPHLRAADPLTVLRRAERLPCPHCAATRVHRWGRSGQRQRYRCRECDRTFSELTGTALHGLHRKELWPAFCRCMLDGLTVRAAAARLGIHRDTAFRWRHRLLRGLRLAEESEYPLGNVVSVEESHAYWGTRVIIGIDERGRAAGRTTGSARADAGAVAALLGKRIAGSTVLLAGDGPFGAVARFARTAGVHWMRRQLVDPRFDGRIERVRWHTFRFRRWLVRFRGVATHYLDNYLAWFRLVDGRIWAGLCRRDSAPATDAARATDAGGPADGASPGPPNAGEAGPPPLATPVDHGYVGTTGNPSH